MPEYDEKEKDAYRTLKLPEGASQVEIKRQRDKLARKLHSDVNTTGDENQLKKVNWAYETLTNPAQIEARKRAKRRAAAEKTKAEAARRAAEAARKQRARSAKESEVFGERLRGQPSETRAGTSKAPPSAFRPSSSAAQQQAPTPASPFWHEVPERPPQAVAPPVTAPRRKLGDFVLRLVFLGLPIGIMALVVPAMNAHPNAFLDVMSVICFFWLIAGIAGLFIEW